MDHSDTPTCHTCGIPTPDAYLCRTHTAALLADIRTIPDLLDELDTTITRQDKLLHFNDRRSSAETPLDWNEHAAQIREELADTLTAWCHEVAAIDEYERDPLHAATTPTARAVWLADNIRTCRRHPSAGTAADELGNAVHRAHRAVDHPTIRSRFYVGPCPEQADQGCCDGEVWSFLATATDEQSYMRCTACEHRWDSHQWLRVGPRILARQQQLQAAA